jgi:hypothetical protein
MSFQLLPSYIIEHIASFLIHEDIIMLGEALPKVIKFPIYKRIYVNTKHMNDMWNELSFYRKKHEHCIHICLNQVTSNPHCNFDNQNENEDVINCYYNGRVSKQI